MIAESLDHAFDDMNERVWTEARLKAEEMLGSVKTALRILGEEVLPEEKSRIDQLIVDVQSALGSGEVQRLKKANTQLDKATEPMAAQLIEKALADTQQSSRAS
jgi:molecular chaperone DnaK